MGPAPMMSTSSFWFISSLHYEVDLGGKVTAKIRRLSQGIKCIPERRGWRCGVYGGNGGWREIKVWRYGGRKLLNYELRTTNYLASRAPERKSLLNYELRTANYELSSLLSTTNFEPANYELSSLPNYELRTYVEHCETLQSRSVAGKFPQFPTTICLSG